MNTPLTIDRFLAADAPVKRPRALHDPKFEVISGVALAAILILGFGGWAAASRLDAAVVGEGVVRMAASRQVVQAPAAGIVSTVRVGNGDHVRANQVLMEFIQTEAAAQERSLAARVFGLQAEIARLGADLRGAARVPMPVEFQSLTGQDRMVALDALASEQAQLDAQRVLDSSEAAVLRDRGVQISHQIAGNRQRLSSAQRQGALNNEEYVLYQGLLDQGLATKGRVLALQRSAASIDGDAGATVAEMARLRAQAGEARLQFAQMRSERATRNAERLRQAQNDLQAALPQWHAARAQFQRTVVRAPVAGTVSAAQLPVVGAVVAPGMRLMEIVPAAGSLSVEMRVPLAEAGELRSGQAAQVRLAGAGGRLLPSLHGTVHRVSADSVEDERTGAAYYVASIRVSRQDVDRAGRLGDYAGGIRAGSPVEVVIPTQARSALDFLIGPLAARTSATFRQR